MALNYDSALRKPPVEVRQSYSARDVMLYALGLGLGRDPLDPVELRYLYEKQLRALPTMPVAMAFVSLRELDLGIDYARMVHGEQRLRIHQPLPTSGEVIGSTRIVDIIDRGVDKGALLVLERELFNAANGELLATVGMTAFCRGDGGFGGPSRPLPTMHPIPETKPDVIVDIPTSPRSALIYRLSGDYNPLHVDPAFAATAAFERPILHGLATYGMIAWAVIKTLFGGDPDALVEFDGRFSAPVFPGDTLRIEMWREKAVTSVRATAVERGKLVFNNGWMISR